MAIWDHVCHSGIYVDNIRNLYKFLMIFNVIGLFNQLTVAQWVHCIWVHSCLYATFCCSFWIRKFLNIQDKTGKFKCDDISLPYNLVDDIMPGHVSIHETHPPLDLGWSTSHYNDVIMSAMASQITSLTIVYSTFHSSADQRKHQSSASLAFMRGIHRWAVNSPHKGPVTEKMFPFDDVIMLPMRTLVSLNDWLSCKEVNSSVPSMALFAL